MLPAAAFLGFAKGANPFSSCLLFNSSKLALGIYTSPRTSTCRVSGMCIGMERMVFTLFETSSPTIPSPLVTARVKLPSSYSNAIASPSYLHSTTNSGFETLSDIL